MKYSPDLSSAAVALNIRENTNSDIITFFVGIRISFVWFEAFYFRETSRLWSVSAAVRLFANTAFLGRQSELLNRVSLFLMVTQAGGYLSPCLMSDNSD